MIKEKCRSGFHILFMFPNKKAVVDQYLSTGHNGKGLVQTASDFKED